MMKHCEKTEFIETNNSLLVYSAFPVLFLYSHECSVSEIYILLLCIVFWSLKIAPVCSLAQTKK